MFAKLYGITFDSLHYHKKFIAVFQDFFL